MFAVMKLARRSGRMGGALALMGLLQGLSLFERTVGRRVERQARIKEVPDLVPVLGGQRRIDGDHVAAVGARREQSVTRQLEQRLTDRGAGDLVALGEFALDDALARLERTLLDVVANEPVDLIA